MANITDPAATGGWHLDKRIPVALIVTLALQTAGVFFWMGQLSVRIDQLEAQVLRSSKNSDRLTRLEVQLENMDNTLQRIDERLERDRLK